MADRWLYDSFAERWYRPGGTVWLYSDPHFADDEMKYLRKDYIGDDDQVKHINKVCGKYDTLIILGDIGDKEYVRKLKAGYKVLVMGNHDEGAENFKGYFDEIYEGAVIVGPKLILSHEPVDFPYALNIHGHDHSGWASDSRVTNLCAEWIDYTPVNLRWICESGALKKIPDIHRETIDKAIARKR